MEKLNEREQKAKFAVRLFMNTDKAHRKLCEKKTEVFNIHRSQHMILMELYHLGKETSQKEIAQKLSISEAATAVSLKKLAALGLIEKVCSEKDLRYNEIKISEKGKEIINKSKEIFKEIDSVMTKGISDEELDLFIKTMEKMNKNLKEALD